MKSECTQKETNAQDETAPLLLPGNENVETLSSDQEHETEKNQDEIELSGYKKSCGNIHSTENTEMMPQRKDLVLQIDEVCKSNQDVGLTRENSDQEVAKQSVGDALIASEENVVIEMDTDVDANVSTYRKFKSFF